MVEAPGYLKNIISDICETNQLQTRISKLVEAERFFVFFSTRLADPILNGSKIFKYVLLKWPGAGIFFVLDSLMDYDLDNICAKICADMTHSP
jgi:hypothetical protein